MIIGFEKRARAPISPILVSLSCPHWMSYFLTQEAWAWASTFAMRKFY